MEKLFHWILSIFVVCLLALVFINQAQQFLDRQEGAVVLKGEGDVRCYHYRGAMSCIRVTDWRGV